MSIRDHDRDHIALQTVHGRPFALSAATNSLKLAFSGAGQSESEQSGSERSRPYLWLDPPWILLDSQGARLLESATCPRDAAGFAAWAAGLAPARERSLATVERGAGHTAFVLDSGHRIIAIDGSTEDDNDGLWYDDWYFSDE